MGHVEIDIFEGAILTDMNGRRWRVVWCGDSEIIIERAGFRLWPSSPRISSELHYKGEKFWFTSSYFGRHRLIFGTSM